MCPLRYFIEYTLGIKQKSGIAAVKGNVVHKAMEGLGLWKIATDKGERVQDDLYGNLPMDKFEPDTLTEIAYDYYSSIETHLKWDNFHKNECIKWTRTACTMDGGRFDPRNCNMFAIETRFDIELPYDWAKFDYTLLDQHITGTFSIKGAIDVLIELDKDTLLIRDWKTGARKCWVSGKPKTYQMLQEDFQLMLYWYAVRKKFPQYKYVLVSIVYIKDGGEFLIHFDDSTEKKVENLLRRRFELIKNVDRPKRKRGFYCRFCEYDKFNDDFGMSKCDFFKNEVYTIGANLATEIYGNHDALTKYQDGGGQYAGEKNV